jgi:hypothetical protein
MSSNSGRSQVPNCDCIVCVDLFLQRRENEGYREPERKKDILKAIDGEKRQQHEQVEYVYT